MSLRVDMKPYLVVKILLRISVIAFLITSLVFISMSSLQLASDNEPIPRALLPACLPRNHIMYLKTHKCGSSTIQNIFLRYGYYSNLTFALPAQGNYLGSPQPFKASMIPSSLLPKDGKVDMFCVHTRLSRRELRKVLKEDAFWVTSVRNPSTLYESIYNYFHLNSFYQMNLETFLNKTLSELLKYEPYTKFGNNQMLFDMGFERNLSLVELRRAINSLDDVFDLVMISEKMDESLILLRHKLCWSLEDVLVFSKNSRRNEVKSKLNFTPEQEQNLADLNSADYLLYNHFYAKHVQLVLEFGVPRMEKEIKLLREKEMSITKCVWKKRCEDVLKNWNSKSTLTSWPHGCLILQTKRASGSSPRNSK